MSSLPSFQNNQLTDAGVVVSLRQWLPRNPPPPQGRFLLLISVTLKTEALSSSEMLMPVYQTGQHHIPENSNLDTRHSENLKFHIVFTLALLSLLSSNRDFKSCTMGLAFQTH
jgi:hypothetical protein